jgi:hypothetical protein
VRLDPDWTWPFDCFGNSGYPWGYWRDSEFLQVGGSFPRSYVHPGSEQVLRSALTISPLVACSWRSSEKACLPCLKFVVNGGVSITRASRHPILVTTSNVMDMAASFIKTSAHTFITVHVFQSTVIA